MEHGENAARVSIITLDLGRNAPYLYVGTLVLATRFTPILTTGR
jgi:hypothetical protein